MKRSARAFFCALGVALLSPMASAAVSGVKTIRLQLSPLTASGGESLQARVTLIRDGTVPPAVVHVSLSSSNPSLVRFASEELVVPADQNVVPVEFGTHSVQVRTPITISAKVAGSTVEGHDELELVPALLKRVTLNRTSLTGTLGSSVQATAELNAPAPPGGIQLYLSPIAITPPGPKRKSSDPIRNPAVLAGSKTVSFPIEYNDILASFSAALLQNSDFSPSFETQSRKVDLILALDPQGSELGQPIPGKAVSISFDLVPLKITSFSVQPATLASNGEAVATFNLNAAPGQGERVLLSGNQQAAVVLIGSSCQVGGRSNPAVELPLLPGTTSYNFKVCARPVTGTATGKVLVSMRSGGYDANVTVHP
ncbi:MAG: hypothetical protein ABI718_13875 [Acidobacteriota bacterium]